MVIKAVDLVSVDVVLTLVSIEVIHYFAGSGL